MIHFYSIRESVLLKNYLREHFDISVTILNIDISEHSFISGLNTDNQVKINNKVSDIMISS